MSSGLSSEDSELFSLIAAGVFVCPQVVGAVTVVVAVGGALTPRGLPSRSSHQEAAKSAQSSRAGTRF